MEEVKEHISLFHYQTLDSSKLTLLYKSLKAAKFAMTDHVVLNCTNMELFATKIRKKQQV